jgi:2-iminobutanoate/2-iminopropanoate deaminase
MKQEIKTDKAQSAKGLLSQAVVSNGLIFTSGFIHVSPDGEMVEGSTEDKFKQVMSNIEEVLKAGGADLNDILKATIYVTDISILGDLNKLYVTYFEEPYPVREAVCVKDLPLGASIEISVIARKDSK